MYSCIQQYHMEMNGTTQLIHRSRHSNHQNPRHMRQSCMVHHRTSHRPETLHRFRHNQTEWMDVVGKKLGPNNYSLQHHNQRVCPMFHLDSFVDSSLLNPIHNLPCCIGHHCTSHHPRNQGHRRGTKAERRDASVHLDPNMYTRSTHMELVATNLHCRRSWHSNPRNPTNNSTCCRHHHHNFHRPRDLQSRPHTQWEPLDAVEHTGDPNMYNPKFHID